MRWRVFYALAGFLCAGGYFERFVICAASLLATLLS